MARKRGSKNNAVKHGAYAKGLILPDENVDEFIELVDALMEEWKPVGYLEEETVMSSGQCIWLKRRVEIFYYREVMYAQKLSDHEILEGIALERRYAQHGPGRARRNQSLI